MKIMKKKIVIWNNNEIIMWKIIMKIIIWKKK